MSVLLNLGTEVEQETCCSCGVVFAMTAALVRFRKRDNGTFYCPNGHAQSYIEKEADKLRRELETERERHQAQRARADDNWATVVQRDRTIQGLRGVIARLKKKAYR